MNDIVKDWILFISVVIGIIFLCFGCQSPRTSYTNGIIVWCSTSAVGIGYGEYIEVPAGAKLERVTTNSCPAIIGGGDSATVSRLVIDNSLILTNSWQADGAGLP